MQLLTNRPLLGAQLNMAHPLSKGLVGCWLLNDQAGLLAMDSSPYGNHGKLGGFASPPHRAFNGLKFDGTDDYVDIPHQAKLSFERTDKFSIEAWINPDSSIITAGAFHIFEKQVNSGNYEGYTLFNSDGQLGVMLMSVGTNRIYVITTANLKGGVWQHGVMTYDGSSAASGVKLYSDGVAKAMTVIADALTATILNTVNVNIGARGGAAQFWKGLIGLVRVWKDRVLLPNDIQSLYLNPYQMFLK